MLMNTIMSMYKKDIIIAIITDKSHVALETIHYIFKNDVLIEIHYRSKDTFATYKDDALIGSSRKRIEKLIILFNIIYKDV